MIQFIFRNTFFMYSSSPEVISWSLRGLCSVCRSSGNFIMANWWAFILKNLLMNYRRLSPVVGLLFFMLIVEIWSKQSLSRWTSGMSHDYIWWYLWCGRWISPWARQERTRLVAEKPKLPTVTCCWLKMKKRAFMYGYP